MNKVALSDSVGDAIAGKRRILVVDASRVVRTTLAKRLEGGFSVVEEDNGESAWQRLMLDNSIVVVISSIDPPRLSARDLLERMRGSALRRLRETPMVLLVSDDNPDANVDEWQRQGVAGFMTKSMSREVMAECLENVLAGPSQTSNIESENKSQDKPQGELHELHEKTPEKTRTRRTISTAPLLGEEDFIAAVSSLPHEINSKEPLCVLVFGIDRLNEYIGRFGADVSDLLTGRVAKLLAAKIDPRDVLGRCGEDCVAIISHGVDLRSGVHFGKRVCKSMATGQIAVHGRKIRLTTSVGVAATPDDHVDSPGDLLALAETRLKQAMVCGGNTVCTELRPDCPQAQRDKELLELFRLLGEVMETEQKEALGMAIQPLLRKTNPKLVVAAKRVLGLPEDDLEFPDI
jgi:diguanylate cyclase (GGDEF)-like protein